MDDKLENLNDPLGLVSQSLDGELGSLDKNRLDQALAKSESLQAEQQKMRAVDGLMRRWGSDSVELDWENFSALIQARIENEDEDLEKVDGILDQWAAKNALIDDHDFAQAVMARVRRSNARPFYHAWPVKWGGVLATAASIILVVLSTMESKTTTRTVVNISHGHYDSQGAEGDSVQNTQRIVVAFAREPVSPDTESRDRGISFGSVGSSPIFD